MSYISSQKNKEFLWNILYDNKEFANIPNDKLKDVIGIFERTINDEIQNGNNNDIMESNKSILKNAKERVEVFKMNMFKSKNVKDDFRGEKIEVFDKNLQQRKNSMDKMLNPVRPVDIDFTDKTDNPMDNSEINSLLESMQRARNIELEINVKNNDNNDDNNNDNDNNDNNNNDNNDKNLIKTNNIMENKKETENAGEKNSDGEKEVVPKLKISSIEDLLGNDINVIDINNKRKDNGHFNLINKDFYKQNSSNVSLSDMDNLINHDNRKEQSVNSSNDMDSIYKFLNVILNNQKLIMQKIGIL